MTDRIFAEVAIDTTFRLADKPNYEYGTLLFDVTSGHLGKFKLSAWSPGRKDGEWMKPRYCLWWERDTPLQLPRISPAYGRIDVTYHTESNYKGWRLRNDLDVAFLKKQSDAARKATAKVVEEFIDYISKLEWLELLARNAHTVSEVLKTRREYIDALRTLDVAENDYEKAVSAYRRFASENAGALTALSEPNTLQFIDPREEVAREKREREQAKAKVATKKKGSK